MELCNNCKLKLIEGGLTVEQINKLLEYLKSIPEKVLPCPKCGSENIKFIYEDDNSGKKNVIQITCFNCHYFIPRVDGGRSAVIEKWNKR